MDKDQEFPGSKSSARETAALITFLQPANRPVKVHPLGGKQVATR